MDTTAQDMSHWMRDLPPRCRQLPVNQLAIPGTHSSLTYSIRRQADLAPNVGRLLRFVFRLLPSFARTLILHWYVTQHLDISEQLRSGVRYFDFQIAIKKHHGKFYAASGLYGLEFRKVLAQLRDFVESHPAELVIVDIRETWGFGPRDHERLMELIADYMGDFLLRQRPTLKHLTLETVQESGEQMIVFYTAYTPPSVQIHHRIWNPEDSLSSDFPGKSSVSGLKSFINKKRDKEKDTNKFFIAWWVLTPTFFFKLWHLWGTLEKTLAKTCNSALAGWLLTQRIGPEGCNIVALDFVDPVGENTCSQIVNLNFNYGF